MKLQKHKWIFSRMLLPIHSLMCSLFLCRCFVSDGVFICMQASKKIADAKLAKDFQAVLKEFQKAQRLAAERETAYSPFVPQAVLPSRYIWGQRTLCSSTSLHWFFVVWRFAIPMCMTPACVCSSGYTAGRTPPCSKLSVQNWWMAGVTCICMVSIRRRSDVGKFTSGLC